LLPDCRYPVGGRPGGAPVRAGCGPSVAFRRTVVACPGRVRKVAVRVRRRKPWARCG